ncbi:MAG: hypothetical protein M3021_05650 [Actinomycetota bacterium]|nr:hypothetical protein [Actinomycetota bacterium]
MRDTVTLEWLLQTDEPWLRYNALRDEVVSKAWSAFDFGQKKTPVPWLTLLALRILHRSQPQDA